MRIRHFIFWGAVFSAGVVGCACPGPKPQNMSEREPAERGGASEAAAQSAEVWPSARLTLSDWGIEHPKEIQYVELGLLRFRDGIKLVVYDVKKNAPDHKPVEISSAPLTMENGISLIGHFDYGNRNARGGYYSAYAKAPSSGSLRIGAFPDGGRGLDFSYMQKDKGYTGFWIHLFDFKSPTRILADTRNVNFLTFSIRGERGTEKLAIKVADKTWEQKGDSLPIGDVGEFLPAGQIETYWQQAWVPLRRLPARIDPGELATIVFGVSHPSNGRVQVRDMAFALSANNIVLPRPPRDMAKRPIRTGMWIWETEELALNGKKIDELLQFCEQNQITDVFLQIPRPGPAHLKNLIRRIHAYKIRVDALDGDPEYALEERHGGVLERVQKIVDYNASVNPEERYDGVRYDNEPYLVPGFAGVRKQKMLKDYLSLLEKIHRLTGPAKLSFGVDIPFWFDGYTRFNEAVAAVDGRPLTHHIIDVVDNLAIMDYRTQAYGPDGVIAHGIDELEYAALKGKDVFVGLETVYVPDEEIKAFSPKGEGTHIVLDDFDGGSLRVTWVSKTGVESETQSGGADGAIVLGEIYGAEAPASKLTFEPWTVSRLREVTDHVTSELGYLKSFVGYAVHSYESFRPWLLRQGEKKVHKETPGEAAPVVYEPPRRPTPLPVPGFNQASHVAPAGDGPWPRPVVVVLHSSADRPEWECDMWQKVADFYGWVLCTRGVRAPGTDLTQDRWTYPGEGEGRLEYVKRELAAALGALGSRYPGKVSNEGMILAGFSLGANLIPLIVDIDVGDVRTVFLVEGGIEHLDGAKLGEFKKKGITGIGLAMGVGDKISLARQLKTKIKKAGLKTVFVDMAGAGHEYRHDFGETGQKALKTLLK